MSRTAQAQPETAAELARAAAAAEAEAAELERQGLDGEAEPDLPAIDEHRAQARRWGFLAERRRRADARAAKAERDAALGQLAADIRSHAGGMDAGMLLAALDDARKAAERFASLVNAHNAAVGGLYERARGLGCREAPPAGPSADDLHVAVAGRGVQVGSLVLQPSPPAAELPLRACRGQSVRLPAALIPPPPPHRPGFLYYAPRSGQVVPRDDAPDQGFLTQMREGALVRLSDDEITAYVAGELVIDAADIARRGAVQVARMAEDLARERAGARAAQERAQANLEGVFR